MKDSLSALIPQKIKKSFKKIISRSKFKKFLVSRNQQMKYIDNLEALDLELKQVDERAKISDDEMRVALSEFSYVTKRNFPKDPYSQEYFDSQIELYLEISGKSAYKVENEYTPFDFEALKNNPFPYCTESPTTVGDQLIAQGFLIKCLNLKPNSRIVEFGPGWGNTTLHFAQMGYQVTAVEIDPSLIKLIEYRTGMLSKKVRTIQQDMLEFSKQDNGKYDAAIFFECFHHCFDHISLLKNLYRAIADDGIIAFAAEPIADFSYPWGVRLDGMSVWSIRKFGWLELGFSTSYFLKTLLLFGWSPQRYRCNESPLSDVIIARKSQQYYEPSEITLPPDECETWAPKEQDPSLKLRFTSQKSVMTCQRDVNAAFVEFCISNFAPFAINFVLTAGNSLQKFSIDKNQSQVKFQLPVKNWDGKVTISSKTWCPDRVFRNGDKRDVGLAIHYLQLREDGN